MRYLLILALAIFAMSCSQSNDHMTRYHENGMAKPVALLAPMIDTASFDAPWSISEELTSSIQAQLAAGKKLFVVSKEDELFIENPFGQDLTWIKRDFAKEEFAIFFELVEHEVSSITKLKKESPSPETSSNLNIAVRLRVIDNRGQVPKLVLQEIVRESYFIPKTLTPTDYNTVTWGTSEYAKSPMGIAHAQISKELATRVSDYILLAKSR